MFDLFPGKVQKVYVKNQLSLVKPDEKSVYCNITFPKLAKSPLQQIQYFNNIKESKPLESSSHGLTGGKPCLHK